MSRTIHDGEQVRHRLQTMDWSVAQLAEALALTERTLYRRLEKAHWTANDLREAGKVLGWDFLAIYRLERPGEGWLFVPEAGGVLRIYAEGEAPSEPPQQNLTP